MLLLREKCAFEEVQFARKFEIQSFAKELIFISWTLALLTCTGHEASSYLLSAAVWATRGTNDTVFYAVLSARLNPLLSSFEKNAN